MKLAVICPHFAPDIAPTGEIITRVVNELAQRGHEIHVVTALPYYLHHRVEPGWGGKLVRREVTPWGSITRINPFAGADKSSIPRRALGFAAFSALGGVAGLRGGKVDGVLAMSPPLTMGLTGWAISLVRRGPLVFNVQDVFPDAAIESGAISNRHLVRIARWLERTSYHRSAAVTVLSDDMAANVRSKVKPSFRAKVHNIPNFVDVAAITPQDRMTSYRQELGIGNEPVVLYAGNVGFSQSLDLLLAAAKELPDVTFLVNGGGSALPSLRDAARGLVNVRFGGYQPKERLSEVLATGDLHVVPLKAGLAASSVPSKTYSILAAGRPVLASIDPGTEVTRIVAAANAGRCVGPDAPQDFVTAIREMVADQEGLRSWGASGRRWVEHAASPASVAAAYEHLFATLQ